jgi:hypothetical protein
MSTKTDQSKVPINDTHKLEQPVQASPQAPTGPTDKFGVAKVFADGEGPSWYIGDNGDPNTDPRVKNPETDGNEARLTNNADGSSNISGKWEVRYAVAATEFDGQQ